MDGTLEIFDVKERQTGEVKPPSIPTAPSPSSSSSIGGFPAHKKRVSAFKQKRQQQAAGLTAETPPTVIFNPEKNVQPKLDPVAAEKKQIDEENRAVLDSMSQDEIAQAQKDLLNGLDPSLVQVLLRRANLDEKKKGPDPFDVPEPVAAEKAEPPAPTNNTSTQPKKEEQKKKPTKKVTFEEVIDEDAPPAKIPPNLFPATQSPPRSPSQIPQRNQGPLPSDANLNPNLLEEESLPAGSTHFPHAPSAPDLDPSDPNFLENMHKKYFPNLPADPSKLAWMAPVPTPDSTADRESPYYPGQESLPVSALRFDFKGSLLSPRVSRSIPVSKGLHHHGEAPEAAGYTIPELARLARSAVPAQRCLAFQTLGRMLYRLGKGEWGHGAGGRDGDEDDLAFALWRCFSECRVIETLTEAANVEHGHMSSKAYATEAIWLLEKGGWKERWRGL